jgi:photosystem II protein PsbQ
MNVSRTFSGLQQPNLIPSVLAIRGFSLGTIKKGLPISYTHFLDPEILMLRSFFSLLLVLVATLLVACGGPVAVTPPPTYTQFQLERIQDYKPSILEGQQRLLSMAAAIQAGNTQEVQAISGGPLGETLRNMQNLNRNLLPKDQELARTTTRALFDHLVEIDQALNLKNINTANRAYAAAKDDFVTYLNLIPTVEVVPAG